MGNNEIDKVSGNSVSVNAPRAARRAGNNRAKTLVGFFCALLVVTLIFAAATHRVAAQAQGGETAEMNAYRAAMEDADQKILAEEQAHSELMKNLEHLTTQIGPRLTGSKQMQDASAWTLSVFRITELTRIWKPRKFRTRGCAVRTPRKLPLRFRGESKSVPRVGAKQPAAWSQEMLCGWNRSRRKRLPRPARS